MKINKYWKYFIGAAIPICLILYFAGISALNFIPESLIGGKVDYYKESSETGAGVECIPYRQMTFIVEFILLYVFLFYYETIEKHCIYAPILIKALVLEMGYLVMFSEIEVLGNRFHEIFGMFNVLAYTQCMWFIKPNYVVRIGLAAFSLTFYLAQMYNDVYFH